MTTVLPTMDTLDYLILNRPITRDDHSMVFDRLVDDVGANIICFLPWCVSMPLARNFGLLPAKFLACYEVPNALVGSEPERCIAALNLLVCDALALLEQHRVSDAIVVGLSAGTAPATVLANLTGSRLCSVTSADRGDQMLWESQATQEIKSRALRKGYSLEHFTRAFSGHNPIENLSRVRPDSVFVVSTNDPFVPSTRSRALIDRVRVKLPRASIVRSDRGHVRTLRGAVRQLSQLLATQRRPIGPAERSPSLHSPGP